MEKRDDLAAFYSTLYLTFSNNCYDSMCESSMLPTLYSENYFKIVFIVLDTGLGQFITCLIKQDTSGCLLNDPLWNIKISLLLHIGTLIKQGRKSTEKLCSKKDRVTSINQEFSTCQVFKVP